MRPSKPLEWENGAHMSGQSAYGRGCDEAAISNRHTVATAYPRNFRNKSFNHRRRMSNSGGSTLADPKRKWHIADGVDAPDSLYGKVEVLKHH